MSPSLAIHPTLQEAARVGRASVCKECGAAVVWVTTVRGKQMPLDTAPDDEGRIVLVQGTGSQGLVARQLRDGQRGPDGLRWTSHFASCLAARSRARRRTSSRVEPELSTVSVAPVVSLEDRRRLDEVDRTWCPMPGCDWSDEGRVRDHPLMRDRHYWDTHGAGARPQYARCAEPPYCGWEITVPSIAHLDELRAQVREHYATHPAHTREHR